MHVPLPAANCGNGPVVNPPDNVQEFTDEEHFKELYTQNTCLPEWGQPLVDVIINDRCNQTFFPNAENVVNLCSMNVNGVTCGLTHSRSIGPDLNQLNSDCATSSVSCTSNCRNSLIDARNHRGCCVNWRNTSTMSPPALSCSVWKSYKVETPGFCESPLSLELNGTTVSIMIESTVRGTVTVETPALNHSFTAASIVKENYLILLITTGLMRYFVNLLMIL